jgi:hypothetical protein
MDSQVKPDVTDGEPFLREDEANAEEETWTV